MNTISTRQPWVSGVAAACLLATACTVVPLEADRASKALQGGAFDADRYVNANWDSRARPDWTGRAKPLAQQVAAADADVAAAGKTFDGRQAGEGSPWTFVTIFDGRIAAIDRTRRAGRATLDVDGLARPVEVQIGPVVSGFVLRDSLPFIDFDDFPNQIAYADAGRALTDKALAGVGGATAGLKVGDTVRVTGVFPYAGRDKAIVVTPVSVAVVSGVTAG